MYHVESIQITPARRERLKRWAIASLEENGWKIAKIETQPACFRLFGVSQDGQEGRIIVELLGPKIHKTKKHGVIHYFCYEDLMPASDHPADIRRAKIAQEALVEFLSKHPTPPTEQVSLMLRCRAYEIDRWTMYPSENSNVGKVPTGFMQCNCSNLCDGVATISLEREAILETRKKKQRIPVGGEANWHWDADWSYYF